MIDFIRSILRELFDLLQKSAVALYGAVMTFIAAMFIMVTFKLGLRLETSKDDQINNNHALVKENAVLREDRDAWKDTALKIQMRYARHLEDDIRNADTSRH